MIARSPTGWTRTPFGRLLLGIACISLCSSRVLAQPAQFKFWSSAPMAEYRAILEAYQDGEVEDAIALLLESKNQGRGMVELAARVHTSAPDDEVADLLATAAMLHTDTAAIHGLEGRPQDVWPHLEAARRWVDLLEPGPSPRGSFRRRWYLGAGLLLVEQARLGDALRHLDHARRVLPDDVEVLTAMGWIYERFALAPVTMQPSARRSRATAMTARSALLNKETDLKEAADRFSAALAVDPAAPEPALRLARIRFLQGEAADARGRLIELAGRSVPAEVGYVVRLLLGRLDERDGKPDEARARYEQALALVPAGQSAMLALAALEHAVGRPEGVGNRLDAALTEPDDRAEDPWATYLNGALRRGRAIRNALRAEVSR